MKAGPDPKDVVRCRGCGDDIVFLKTMQGAWMPVNVLPTEHGYRGPDAGETIYMPREHQLHSKTCDDPD